MKLKQVPRFTAAVAVLFGVSGMSVGCLEDEGPSGGVGGSAVGGTGAGTSGSGGSGTGVGGTSGGVGGASGAGMGGSGGANMDPTMMLQPAQCSGISNNSACPLVGTCANRACGIADYGTRNCVCQVADGATVSMWACTSCAFDTTNLPAVLVPPGAGADDAGDAGDAGGGAALEACAAGVGDNVPCTEGDRCKQGVGDDAELCVCLLREDDGAGPFIWDCDNPPSFWPPGSF